jgi:hypothetical protein
MSDDLSHADMARERCGGDERTYQHRLSLVTDEQAEKRQRLAHYQQVETEARAAAVVAS